LHSALVLKFTFQMPLYSRTSEQRTRWEQDKFSCYTRCKEVVCFSEVQNVLKLYGNQLFGTLKGVICREIYYIMSLSWRVHYHRFSCIWLFQITIPKLKIPISCSVHPLVLCTVCYVSCKSSQ